MIHPNGDSTNPAGIWRNQTPRRSTTRDVRALNEAGGGGGGAQAGPGEAGASPGPAGALENCLRRVFEEGPVKEPYPRPTLFVRTEHREKTTSRRPNRRAQINQTDRDGSTEDALAGPRPRGPRGLGLRARSDTVCFTRRGTNFKT